MWSMAGRKVGKGLCSQHGAVEGGQGRSFLLYGVVMRIRSVLSSHGAAQPVEQGLRGSRWTTGMGLGRSYSILKGMHVLGHFAKIYFN